MNRCEILIKAGNDIERRMKQLNNAGFIVTTKVDESRGIVAVAITHTTTPTLNNIGIATLMPGDEFTPVIGTVIAIYRAMGKPVPNMYIYSNTNPDAAYVKALDYAGEMERRYNKLLEYHKVTLAKKDEQIAALKPEDPVPATTGTLTNPATVIVVNQPATAKAAEKAAAAQ